MEDVNPASDKSALPLLPSDESETLWRLARIGNMAQIREHADHLESLDPRHAPLASRLRSLAETYQSKKLLILAEALRLRSRDASAT